MPIFKPASPCLSPTADPGLGGGRSAPGSFAGRAATTEVDPKLAESLQNFAGKLLQQLGCKIEPGSNLFASPVSIALALSMVANGAKGETQQEIRQALEQGGISVPDLNKAVKAFTGLLENLDPQIKIRIANAMFPSNEVTLVPGFEQALRADFGAELKVLDYRNANAEAIGTINAVCADKTEGMIKGVFKDLDPETVVVLLNAIYLKAMWQSKFDEKLTQKDQKFTTDQGESVKVPLMVQQNKFRYHEFKADGYQAVSLPYGSGAASMVVFLPNEGHSLKEMLPKMTGTRMAQAIEELKYSRPSKGTIELPRFRTTYETSLVEILSAMGMGRAFTDHADFSNMVEPPERAKISKVIHKAVVDVSEEGTEAAAVTAVAMTRSMSFDPPWHMRVDRPFFFVIENNGIPLFYGAINNPAA